jgi:uncharacterized membrane protein YeaQ/YmgE (transglycosylase-associated protein family)
MDILTYAVFGLIAGVIANVIDPHESSGGVLGAIVLGVLGAVVGGFLANMLFGVGVSGFNFSSFAVAVMGSLLLLFVGRAIRRA